MFQQWLNWRTGLAFVAIIIASGTIFYSQYLAKKIAKEERQKVEQWVEASNSLLSLNTQDTRLPLKIIKDNDDIPIIWTNEKDSIIDHINLDTNLLKKDQDYLQKQLKQLKQTNPPIVWSDPTDPRKINRYYYGNTTLLKEVSYYPIVQLLIVGLFILITIIALRSNYRSTQNQLWAGMAKETAHQLGTPVTSLQGWVEVLKDIPGVEKIVPEIEKDVHRLQLVSDRFGKIGSTPKLEEKDLVQQVQSMISYIKKRAGSKVAFNLEIKAEQPLMVLISPPLFDWVIENLLKNALDAMDATGKIDLLIHEQPTQVLIDVSDTGKGISKANMKKVFNPGFTTKKRGWGLGLTLTKRIVEQYHKGQIFVKSSEVGKGTTFRIILNKG
jgi:C4-dicarboxylate-specific signal transduction histidine kinase